MADDNDAAEVEGEDVLFRELQTTSVYDSLQRAPPERHVLTLSRAEATYQGIADAALGMDAASIAQSAPEIVVQVRKRAGAVQLLIDGFVSEGTRESDTVRVHKLKFHKGLHEDWETNACVLSPLAIVAAVEDGQHPLQQVRVAVMQSFFKWGKPMGDPTLLAEVNLAPHRVSDVRCSVTRAPYPLVFAKPFTVTISDSLVRNNVGNQQVLKSILAIGTGSAGAMTAAVMFLPGVAPVYIAVTGLKAALVGVVVALLRIYGYDLLASAATELSNMKPQRKRLLPVVQTLEVRRALWKATTNYLTSKPIPKDKDVTFTLDEFAKTLESLAVIKAVNDNDDLLPAGANEGDNDYIDPNLFANGHEYRRERVVWNWLVTVDADGVSASGLSIDQTVTAGLRVRISVDDPMACTPETQHHDLECGLDGLDACYLGAAASGTMHDLLRVQKAIVALMAMLDSAIDNGNMGTWPDLYIFAPAIYFIRVLRNRWKTQKTMKGYLRKMSAYKGYDWKGLMGPGFDSRKAWFEQARDLVKVKLLDPFIANNGAVGALMAEFNRVLGKPQAPLASAQTAWVRRLPQRARAQLSTGLFARAADFTTEYADIYTEKAVVREFSNRSGLVKMMTATMKHSKTALQRFVKQWEAGSSTHVALVCMCTGASVPPGGGFREPVRWSALALSTPTDVQFAASIVSVPEHTRRRLRLVARRAQQKCDKSVLEALGLAHTNADLLACQVFGDLWIAELLAMHGAPNAQQVQMLEQASSRAAARLRAAGDLLLRLVVGGNAAIETGEGNDVAPTSTDIALVATQAGRDAGRILDRILFSQDFAAVRTAMVPLIRNCAFTAKRAATAFAKRVPTLLPHAPTASLFGDRYDGVAAFLRATSLTGDAALVHAMTAAYPSTLLLDKADTLDEEQVAALRARAPAKRLVKMPRGQVVAAMRFRLASLQMEPTADDAENLSIDKLAEKLAVVKLGGARRSYYVPFGFGDARPAPTFPPCAAPLFGTVPVFCDALAYAFGSVLRGLKDQAATNPPAKPLCVRLVPVLDCLRDPNAGPEVETAHPNTVNVSRTNVDGKACVTVIYAASRAPVPEDAAAATAPPAAAAAATALPVAEVTRAAEAGGGDAEDDARAVAMAARVSSTAWNAERVVQAVVAALASADIGEEFDAVELTLKLPPDGDERSYWYTVPVAFRRQQRQHRNEVEARRLCRHLDLLLVLLTAELDKIFVDIQQFDLSTQAGRSGVDLAAPPNKDWLAAATEREGLLDTADPTDNVPVRDKLNANTATLGGPTLQGRTYGEAAQTVRAFMDIIKTAQGDLEVALNERPIASKNAHVVRAQTLLQIAPPADARAATRNEASRRALVGALGVGMAMLVPLLQDVRVECAGVTERNRNDADVKPAVARAMDAFGKCAAVRLSEACLVVSEHVSSL